MQQRAPDRSVEFGHLDAPDAGIGPVDRVVDPVDGHSARTFQSAPGHIAHDRAVHVGAFDGVQRHVRPDDDALGVVEVERDGVLQPVDHRRVLVVEQRHLYIVTSLTNTSSSSIIN